MRSQRPNPIAACWPIGGTRSAKQTLTAQAVVHGDDARFALMSASAKPTGTRTAGTIGDDGVVAVDARRHATGKPAVAPRHSVAPVTRKPPARSAGQTTPWAKRRP
jgi:hypothetical protein